MTVLKKFVLITTYYCSLQVNYYSLALLALISKPVESLLAPAKVKQITLHLFQQPNINCNVHGIKIQALWL